MLILPHRTRCARRLRRCHLDRPSPHRPRDQARSMSSRRRMSSRSREAGDLGGVSCSYQHLSSAEKGVSLYLVVKPAARPTTSASSTTIAAANASRKTFRLRPKHRLCGGRTEPSLFEKTAAADLRGSFALPAKLSCLCASHSGISSSFSGTTVVSTSLLAMFTMPQACNP